MALYKNSWLFSTFVESPHWSQGVPLTTVGSGRQWLWSSKPLHHEPFLVLLYFPRNLAWIKSWMWWRVPVIPDWWEGKTETGRSLKHSARSTFNKRLSQKRRQAVEEDLSLTSGFSLHMYTSSCKCMLGAFSSACICASGSCAYTSHAHVYPHSTYMHTYEHIQT